MLSLSQLFTLHFHFHQEAFEFLFTFCHKGGVICISEVIDSSPGRSEERRVGKECQTLSFWAPKSLQMVIAAMKLKDAYSLEGKL